MKQFAIAIDQLLNTVVYIHGDGFGFADETLSARAWRLQSRWYKVINTMFFWQENHCKEAFYSELHNEHLPEVYRAFVTDLLEIKKDCIEYQASISKSNSKK